LADTNCMDHITWLISAPWPHVVMFFSIACGDTHSYHHIKYGPAKLEWGHGHQRTKKLLHRKKRFTIRIISWLFTVKFEHALWIWNLWLQCFALWIQISNNCMEISSFNISRGFPFSLRPIGCLAGFGSPVVYPFVFRNILSGCAQYRLVMKMSSSLLGKIDRHEVYQTYCSCGRHQVMYGNPQIIYYILLLNDNSKMAISFPD
jgi:hypothetical protein